MIEVRVTKEDMLNGKQADICLCPVALAVQRATGKEVHVTYDGFIYFVGSRERVSPTRRDLVHTFIRNFDVEGYRRGWLGLFPNLRPFSFWLRIDETPS